MPEPDLSSILVERIENGDTEGDAVFSELAEYAANDGLSPTNITKLLAVVTGISISSPQKARLLKECMVPKPQSYLPPEIYLKVLSSVGAPELYYKNGKQHKSRRLSLPLQQKLLQWLICVLPYFGNQVYSYTRRSLPLLFGLLSYEFSRPYIATFLVVGTSRQSTLQTKQKVLRPWHIQIVSDLFLRYPQDDSLVLLLHHFLRMDPQLDLRYHFKGNSVPSITTRSNPLGFHDIPILRAARNIRLGSTSQFSTAISDVDLELSQFFKSFAPFSKRRKVDISNVTDLYYPTDSSDTVLINTISSVPALAKNFEKIQFTNPGSVLSATGPANSRIKSLYTSIRVLDSGPLDPFYKKLLFAVKYHVLSDQVPAPKFAFQKLLQFAKFGGLLEYGGLLSHFLGLETDSLDLLEQKIDLLRIADSESLNSKPVLERIAQQIENLYEVNPKRANPTALKFLVNASIATYKFSLEDSDKSSATIKTLRTVVFDFISEKWSNSHLSVKIAFLQFLSVIQSSIKDEHTNFEYLIPPVPLFYHLLCSTNPLIVSEALGYASFLKTLDLSPTSPAQSVRKALIMDCANFIWRDKAFQTEDSTEGCGMFLDSYFLGKLGGLNYFTNSDLVSLRSVGNIIQNPSFAYICAELVWKLEDSSPAITCRHPGPLSEATIERFQRDTDVVWLPMTYADVRLKILRELDEMGFKGLGNFLFTSIRSLTGKRESPDHNYTGDGASPK